MTEKSLADVLEAHTKEDEKRFAALTAIVNLLGTRLDKIEKKVAVGAAAGIFVGHAGLAVLERFPEILHILASL